MSSFFRFLLSTTLRGLFIFLPVALIVLLLGELMDSVVGLGGLIADTIGLDVGEKPEHPALLAILLIVAFSFLIGLLTLIHLSRNAGLWVEKTILRPIPGYRGIKGLITALGGATEVESFQPALLTTASGDEEIVFQIEAVDAERTAVLVPFSPTPMAGTIRIVQTSRLKPIEGGLSKTIDVLSQWGVGTAGLLKADVGQETA